MQLYNYIYIYIRTAGLFAECESESDSHGTVKNKLNIGIALACLFLQEFLERCRILHRRRNVCHHCSLVICAALGLVKDVRNVPVGLTRK